MHKGDIVRFARGAPSNPQHTGIWTYEYGLVLGLDERLKTVTVWSGRDIIDVGSEWCSIAEEKQDFIDELVERYKNSEVGN